MLFKKKENFIDDTTSIKKESFEYAKMALDLEVKNESNIIRSCNSMIMCNAILLIPLVTVFIEMLNKLENVKLFVLIFGFILVSVLFTSIFFAVWAEQLSNDIRTLSSSEIVDDDFYSFYEESTRELEFIYKSKKENNIVKKRFLFVSHILNYSFYGLVIVFGMVLMILM